MDNNTIICELAAASAFCYINGRADLGDLVRSCNASVSKALDMGLGGLAVLNIDNLLDSLFGECGVQRRSILGRKLLTLREGIDRQ